MIYDITVVKEKSTSKPYIGIILKKVSICTICSIISVSAHKQNLGSVTFSILIYFYIFSCYCLEDLYEMT